LYVICFLDLGISPVLSDPKREFAIEVVRRLQNAGHTALWAGGCVRDLVMGHEPDDYDVATSALPEQVQNLFRRTIPVGASFGVIVVVGRGPQGQVEVATFRTEGPYSDGRHPDRVEFSTPEADAQRRDFTINGMFFDPVRDELLDFVGGRADIERRVLRAIGEPRERFNEDKLRLLRAVRFAARFEFELDAATEAAVREMAPQISVVSPERIQQELRRLLVDRHRVAALTLADRTELLRAILPEIVDMHGVPQGKPVQPNGDLWDHTLLVLEKLDEAWQTTVKNLAIAGAAPEPSFTLAAAALLHDVGKPRTISRNGGRLTFYHHEHVGCRIASHVARRLRLSNDERQRIEWLVERHMYLGEPRVMRLSKLKRTLVLPGIEELLALHRADALASTGVTDAVEYCERMLRELPETELNPPPLITGHDLQRLAGLESGPLFKELLEKVREAQLEGTIQSKKDALALVDRLLHERAAPPEAPSSPNKV
jgi:poly(A) polymerase